MNTPKPPLESKIVKKILIALRSRGGWWLKVHGSPMQIAGVPDLIGCYLGYFVSFEVKRDGTKKPTELQAYTISRITREGGVSLVIHSASQALAELDRIDALQEARGHRS